MYNTVVLVFIVQPCFSPFVYNIQNSIRPIKNTYKELFVEDYMYNLSTAFFLFSVNKSPNWYHHLLSRNSG